MRKRWFNAVVLALGLVVFGCRSRIQQGLAEQEAHLVQTVLLERGISAEASPEGGKKASWMLEVPTDKASEAVRVLTDLGLPRERAPGFSEVFGKGSLVPTPLEERALYLQALSGELSRSLETVDGVLSARVHVVLPAPPHPGTQPTLAKASALVRVRAGWLSRVQTHADGLRRLVASGVEGLAPENVSLLFNEAVPTVRVAASPRESKWLRWSSAGLGVLVALLAVTVAGMALQQRRLRRRLQPQVAS